jgi:Tfp pilus assembly pilus retraction ATPase PilT
MDPRVALSAATSSSNRMGYGAVFRLIPTKIATLEQLGIPTVAKEFRQHCAADSSSSPGPTGSGKSTTLAALIDYININFARHIVTVEEPIASSFITTTKQRHHAT